MKEYEIRTQKVFKALSNVVRYKILKMLEKEKLNTLLIAKKLNRKNSNISQHLKVLKDLDLVKFHTEDGKVYYELKRKEIVNFIKLMEDNYKRD